MKLEQSSVWVNGLDYLDSCDSTNLEMLRRLDRDSKLPTFFALVAGEQTGGRGRLERGWVSEPGASLSVTVLIRRDQPAEVQWLTPAAALAVAETIAELLGLDPDDSLADASIELKWPNDVLAQGRKVSGILAQLHPSGHVVLGVGINLRPQQHAPETAISLSELGVVSPDLDRVLANFLARFRAKANFVMQGASDLLAREYRRQLGTLGKTVRIVLPETEIVGVAEEIDADGRIGIRTNGELRWFAAGDVVHLRN
jgi:BirA family biotin operon repressor/biotin-[acetyl-CoA-carboxylase] ligase